MGSTRNSHAFTQLQHYIEHHHGSVADNESAAAA